MEGAFAFPGSDDPLGVTGVGVRPGASTLWHSGARETEGGVRVPESRETFETYPYNPDAPGRTGPQDRGPGPLEPHQVAPVVSAPPNQPRIGRRALVIGGAAAAAMIVAAGTASFTNRPTEPPAEVSEPPVPSDDSYLASLLIDDYNAIGVEVPTDWQVVSEDDFLVLSHRHGRLVARIPEWRNASRNDVSREADYLRDGFDPTGEPTVFEESTTDLTVMRQVTAGRFAGDPATEEVTLILDPSQQLALVLWWATVDEDRQAAAQARTMVAGLRQSFEEF